MIILIIWLNLGCPAIAGQLLGQILGVGTPRQPRFAASIVPKSVCQTANKIDILMKPCIILL